MIDLTGYKLTFDEEFNGLSVSQTGAGTKWADIRASQRLNANADIGFGQSAFVDPASGINPFSVGDGALTITAVKAPSSIVGPGKWASGLLHSKASYSQTYGYFEMRAETPANLGAWPAFWMLPADGTWPPELDVMEGNGTKDLYQVIHTAETGKHTSTTVYSAQPTMVSGYHTYGVSWDAASLSFYFDGKLVGTRKTPADMNKAMYLLVDLAVHNNSAVDSSAKTMSIDYVRAYSKDANATAVALDTVSSPDGLTSADLHGAVSAARGPVMPVATAPDDISHVKTFTKGVLTRETVVHADRSKDVYLYEIAGKTYALEHDSYDAAGALTGIVRLQADGTPVYTQMRDPDGTRTVESYDADGALVSHSITKADGSSTLQSFVDGALKTERVTYAAGSPDLSDTKTYTGGVLTYEAIVHANKSKDIYGFIPTGGTVASTHSVYDAAGKLTLSDQVLRDGSHSTSLFGSGLTVTSTERVADVFKNLGSGSDTFVFHDGFGRDTIKGFHAGITGQDVLRIDDTLASDFAELQSMMSASGRAGADTTITFDAHDSLTLAGVKLADLTAADIRFVHHDGLLG